MLVDDGLLLRYILLWGISLDYFLYDPVDHLVFYGFSVWSAFFLIPVGHSMGVMRNFLMKN